MWGKKNWMSHLFGAGAAAAEDPAVIAARLLGQVAVGPPIPVETLRIFPLTAPEAKPSSYRVLDELLDAGEAEVTEVDENGVIADILVRNRSGWDALLMDGFELRGAKQNRMVNVTILAGKRSDTHIPVSCVEAGRWQRGARRFGSSGRTVSSKLRALKAGMVGASFGAGHGPRTNQAHVWHEVDGYIHKSGAHSPTHAFEDVFTHRSSAIDDLVAQIQNIDAHGAIVAVNGRIVALDVFDQRPTFARLWPALARGFAIDCILERGEPAATLDAVDAAGWLKASLDKASFAPQEVPGVGTYLSLRGEGVAGGLAFLGDTVVHGSLFPINQSATESRSG
jgi:hypothetical protein